MNLTQTYPHLLLRRKPKCVAATKTTTSAATTAATSNNSSPNGTCLPETEYHHTIEREAYLMCTSSQLQQQLESYCMIEHMWYLGITRKQGFILT